MPALLPNSNVKVLITGATGYVGQWTLRNILDRGHSARVVVRSEGKIQTVKELFPEDVDKLEFIMIEDITKEGAFDEAVVGVDAIIHIAKPIPAAGDAPEDIIRIAQDAMMGLLKSALKHGESTRDQVKKIVVTGTIATIWTDQAEPRIFSEKDNNEDVLPKWEAGQRDFATAYALSKILVEKAVQEFLEKHKNEIQYDVGFLSPPFVWGPNFQRVSASLELLSTSKSWFQSITNKSTTPPHPLARENTWVDVRDLAEAHARALEREDATGGERIIICGGSFVWQEWLDALRSVAHSVLPKEKADEIVKGLPEPLSKDEIKYRIAFDNSKSQKVLRLRYRTKEETVRDALAKAVKEGWL